MSANNPAIGNGDKRMPMTAFTNTKSTCGRVSCKEVAISQHHQEKFQSKS